jgi:hypothetical protein
MVRHPVVVDGVGGGGSVFAIIVVVGQAEKVAVSFGVKKLV